MEDPSPCEPASLGFPGISRVEPGRLAREAPMLLAYPSGDPATARRVAEELWSMGVEELLLCGRIQIGRFRALGKGKSSIVLAGLMGDEVVAVKVRRTDSGRGDVEGEAELLRAANSVGVGPRLRASSRDAIAMELIEGPGLYEFLREARADELKGVLRSSLDKARALDAAGISHGELNDPSDHVLVRNDEEPREAEIIDFGSSSASRRASNVTQLAGALFVGGPMSSSVLGALGLNREAAIAALRAYKAGMSSYEELLEALRLP